MPAPNIAQIAYQTIQQGKTLAGLAHKGVTTKLMELMVPAAMPNIQPVSKEVLNELRNSISALEKRDWLEAEQGVYPKSQLFNSPWLEWASRYPLIWLDLPSTWGRRISKRTRDIPKNIDKKNYPDYYLQNFHHQTDGYLSDHSAELYDLQVEILFNGTADSMRRRVIAPLQRGLKRFNKRSTGSLRVLDIATGTGNTIKQIKSAIPDIELIGLDLSEAYLREANRSLNNNNKLLVQLIKGNAEKLPFADGSIQGVTCVYLFHELPQKARQNVLKECWRVIEEGGILILADSIQLSDSPKFKPVLENFQKVFHEPYYRDYLNDDIEKRLKDAGFQAITAESHFMTRVWKATKPIAKSS